MGDLLNKGSGELILFGGQRVILEQFNINRSNNSYLTGSLAIRVLRERYNMISHLEGGLLAKCEEV